MSHNNTKNKFKFFSIFSILVFFQITGCKKATDTIATGTFYIHLHTNIDTNEVDDINVLYKDSLGRHFGLNTAQFYISNVRLQNINGSIYTLNNINIIKDIATEQYLLGNAPIGTYSSITFDVGLDNTTNNLTPNSFTSIGDSSNTSMWFGSTSLGYQFMKIKGFADTTTNQSGLNLVPFYFAIGNSSNRKTITMPIRGTGNYTNFAPYILTANNTNYIHLICDYGKLLNNINFKTQDSTDTYNINATLATTIANNILNMFRYEE